MSALMITGPALHEDDKLAPVGRRTETGNLPLHQGTRIWGIRGLRNVAHGNEIILRKIHGWWTRLKGGRRSCIEFFDTHAR